MAKITNIAVHHTGGTAGDPLASSAHLTAEKISAYHKSKWNFPSRFNTNPKTRYAGYNAIIERDGTLVWTRAIGEETAAQRGYNHNTISICVIGNFSARPVGSPRGTVDAVTEEQTRTLKWVLAALAEHRLYDINALIAPGTVYRLSASRIQPHRFYGNTSCYGTGLANDWAQNFARDYYAEKYGFAPSVVSLFIHFLDLLRTQYPSRFGSDVDERECEGFIN